MFVGNCAKQHQDFVYRVPGAKSARMQRIEIGRQIQISGELDRETVDDIVRQHAPYGMAAASEVDHLTEFVGLCYSVDKQIPAATIFKLMTHNSSVLTERGKETRRRASVAGNEHLETSLAETGRPETLRAMETSIVEENHDERDSEPAIAEGYRMSRSEEPQVSRRPRRGRG